jgi:hypothetical protein
MAHSGYSPGLVLLISRRIESAFIVIVLYLYGPFFKQPFDLLFTPAVQRHHVAGEIAFF